mgnify:CR=1 FL=1
MFLSDADRALGELSGLGRNMVNPHLLVRPFIRREAVLSSRIEGTQADIADLYAYEAGKLPLPGIKPSAPEADVREVRNYVVALEYGLERVNTLPVSLRLMRELHERLMEGVRGDRATPGEFRRTQNWIGCAECTINEADYLAPPVQEMHEALDAFEKYIHAENGYPPLVRLALIHSQFEAIHPFLDGNGRIGRLLLTLLLVSWKLLPSPLLYLSAYFERHRQEYYDRLYAVSASGDWRGWLLFVLRGVIEQAQEANDLAKHLEDLQIAWRAKFEKARGSALLLKMVDLLFENPVWTVGEMQGNLGVSFESARENVSRLIAAGMLREVSGRLRNRVYVAEEILRVMSLGRTTD